MMRDLMAIADEVLAPPVEQPAAETPIETPLEAPAKGRPHIKLRLAFGFVLGLVLVGGASAAAMYAWDNSYEGRVLPGVQAGGISLAGMDRAQAIAALDAAYAAQSAGQVVVETDAGVVAVPYRQFGRHVDTASMTEAALQAGREGTVAERALGEIRLAMTGRTIEPTLVLDEAALATTVRDALARMHRAPVDAQVVKDGDTTTTIPAQEGRAYDGEAAIVSALDAVRRLDAPPEVRVAATSTVIPPALTDVEAEAAVVAAGRMDAKLVVTFRDQQWKIKAAKVRKWLGFDHSTGGSVTPTVNMAAITKALKPVAKGVRRPPASAIYFKSRGKVIGVAPSHDGLRLNVPATAAAIAQAITARGQGVSAPSVKVHVQKVEPKLTTEEATKKGPLMSMLGMWKTWFPVSERNYFGANIWQPAAIINGTVLYPGQRFEWWSALGPVTSSRGFGPGGFIAGNHTEPTGAFGGGMCSSSTTLFNAALRAGLQMGARSNHKYYINRYPLGLDATVSKLAGGGGQTMSFTNDMKHPIVIRGIRYTAGGLGWVRYEIWGIPDGRTVSLSRPSVSNVVKATTHTVYTSTLPRGVREQTEYPANQMDVSVTRVVRKDGRIIHRETYRTHYVLWNGVIQIGR
jgi:vancomycin resistance protein YoaR